MKNLLLGLLLTFSTSSFALLTPKTLNYIINSCKDVHGIQVDFVFHDDIQGMAYATVHNTMFTESGEIKKGGRYIPVIHITTGFFKIQSDITQAFVLAHECGHQKLGHVAEMTGSVPKDEFDADCYAVNFLIKSRILTSKKQLLQIEKDFYVLYGDLPFHRSDSHPGTLERFDHVNECYAKAKSQTN